jgi:hypothetical protein
MAEGIEFQVWVSEFKPQYCQKINNIQKNRETELWASGVLQLNYIHILKWQ